MIYSTGFTFSLNQNRSDLKCMFQSETFHFFLIRICKLKNRLFWFSLSFILLLLLCWRYRGDRKRLKEWTVPVFLPSYLWWKTDTDNRKTGRLPVLFDWSLLKTVVTDGLNSLSWKDIFNRNIISQSAIALLCLRWWVYTERPKKERSIMARYNTALIINITSNYIQKSANFKI